MSARGSPTIRARRSRRRDAGRRGAGAPRPLRDGRRRAGHQRDGRHRPHEPRSGALAGGRRRPAAAALAADYLLLELDRATGKRGARARVAEDHLVALTGAEDALVTNNNAAAVALAVGLAGRGGGVVVSRGELVEIGGGVRIPDIVRRAGAKLIEVGTTNRTRAADFEEPLAERPRRGPSCASTRRTSRWPASPRRPTPPRSPTLAHEHGAIVIDDLGSGALLDTAAFGLAHEPMPDERLAAGADLVTFSGDKLVGGPQAGFIVGRADLVARIRRDPLARAMRPDKVTMAAVAADARAVPRRPGDDATSRSGG